ncbi:MAG: hypothetical protein ACTSPB_06445 [Candidatus Thorarchaeota archaeon]
MIDYVWLSSKDVKIVDENHALEVWRPFKRFFGDIFVLEHKGQVWGLSPNKVFAIMKPKTFISIFGDFQYQAYKVPSSTGEFDDIDFGGDFRYDFRMVELMRVYGISILNIPVEFAPCRAEFHDQGTWWLISAPNRAKEGRVLKVERYVCLDDEW